MYDTDALGHVNNTRLPLWFELARNDVINLLSPAKDPKDWSLIMARIEVDYLDEIFFGPSVEVRTYIEKIGRASFVVLQEAFQRDTLCARGKATVVYYDWETKKSAPVPQRYRDLLAPHMVHRR
jgi:acyl-CoA thioester hydrolase